MCRRPIKMSPVCHLQMTLPGGFPGGVGGDGSSDERWGAFAPGRARQFRLCLDARDPLSTRVLSGPVRPTAGVRGQEDHPHQSARLDPSHRRRRHRLALMPQRECCKRLPHADDPGLVRPAEPHAPRRRWRRRCAPAATPPSFCPQILSPAPLSGRIAGGYGAASVPAIRRARAVDIPGPRLSAAARRLAAADGRGTAAAPARG